MVRSQVSCHKNIAESMYFPELQLGSGQLKQSEIWGREYCEDPGCIQALPPPLTPPPTPASSHTITAPESGRSSKSHSPLSNFYTRTIMLLKPLYRHRVNLKKTIQKYIRRQEPSTIVYQICLVKQVHSFCVLILIKLGFI